MLFVGVVQMLLVKETMMEALEAHVQQTQVGQQDLVAVSIGTSAPSSLLLLSGHLPTSSLQLAVKNSTLCYGCLES